MSIVKDSLKKDDGVDCASAYRSASSTAAKPVEGEGLGSIRAKLRNKLLKDAWWTIRKLSEAKLESLIVLFGERTSVTIQSPSTHSDSRTQEQKKALLTPKKSNASPVKDLKEERTSTVKQENRAARRLKMRLELELEQAKIKEIEAKKAEKPPKVKRNKEKSVELPLPLRPKVYRQKDTTILEPARNQVLQPLAAEQNYTGLWKDPKFSSYVLTRGHQRGKAFKLLSKLGCSVPTGFTKVWKTIRVPNVALGEHEYYPKKSVIDFHEIWQVTTTPLGNKFSINCLCSLSLAWSPDLEYSLENHMRCLREVESHTGR